MGGLIFLDLLQERGYYTELQKKQIIVTFIVDSFMREKPNINQPHWVRSVMQNYYQFKHGGYEIKNENIGFMTVTDVFVSSDHSYCKIYVSFLNNAKNSIETLNRAKGFVRSSLAKKVNMRRVPEITFVLDDSYEKQKHLEELISKESSEIEKFKK